MDGGVWNLKNIFCVKREGYKNEGALFRLQFLGGRGCL
jgi:hypothetical protein